jgi:hypothetical protein
MVVHSTIIEQMKLLQMFWTTGDPILTSEDSNEDTLQLRMKQRYVLTRPKWSLTADVCSGLQQWPTHVGPRLQAYPQRCAWPSDDCKTDE